MVREEKERERGSSLAAYLGGATYDDKDDEGMRQAVLQGMKKMMAGPPLPPPPFGGASSSSSNKRPRGATVLSSSSIGGGGGGSSSSITTSDLSWVEVVSGSVLVEGLGETPLVTLRGMEVGELATVAVTGCELSSSSSSSSSSFSSGGGSSYYYEVEMMSEGVVQVGWANEHLEADAGEGDGVGDDMNSYGYDGSKHKVRGGGSGHFIIMDHSLLS